jgi:N-acetylglucosamine-6-phosphate deacetylase
VHREEHIRDGTLAEFRMLEEAAAGHLRLVTPAPERHGALLIIREAVSRGIVVSLGHTNAAPSVIAAAVDAGARMGMHLFNGCAQLIRSFRRAIRRDCSRTYRIPSTAETPAVPSEARNRWRMQRFVPS